MHLRPHVYNSSPSTHLVVLLTNKPPPACMSKLSYTAVPFHTVSCDGDRPACICRHTDKAAPLHTNSGANTPKNLVLCCICAGSGGPAGRTAAYSPDAFDDVPKKGKLAQRLLGGSKGVSGKLVFGSHVAGKHHKWAEPLDAGSGFEGGAAGSMRAAEVQQVRHTHLFIFRMHWPLFA